MLSKHVSALADAGYVRSRKGGGGSSGWLASATMNLDETIDSAQEGLADQDWVEQAARRHGAVAKHDEVLRGRAGLVFLDARHQGRDGVEEPLAVGEDGLVGGMVGIGILGYGVEEGAPAKAG
jgi:hypothetical protein